MAVSKRNRYSKSTTGLNAIGFFASQVEYTTAANYSAFVTSAATAANNGQMGVFLYPAMTLQSGAANLNAGDRFFIAQIVDGDIKKTPILTYDGVGTSYASNNPTSATASFTVRKTAYSAPVLQSVALGFNGTSGDLGIPTTAPSTPTNYTFSVRDTTPSTQPFPVQSANITVKIANTKTDTAFALASDFVNAVDYEKSSDVPFCTCDVKTNGTTTDVPTTTVTFVNGSNIATSAAGTPAWAVGDIVEVDATGFSYKIVQVISTTVFVLDRPYQGASFTTAAGGTGKKTAVTAVGLYITAVTEDTTFVVSSGNLPLTIAPTVITAWKQGSGAPWQVAEMEKETSVMSGFTYGNAPFVEDMGKPTSFVLNPETSTVQYTTYFCRFRNSTESMAYANELASSYGYIIIACPNGTTPNEEISKILTNV